MLSQFFACLIRPLSGCPVCWLVKHLVGCFVVCPYFPPLCCTLLGRSVGVVIILVVYQRSVGQLMGWWVYWSFAQSIFACLIRRSSGCSVCWLVNHLVGWSVGLSISVDWFVGWLVGLMVNWLVGWLVGLSICWSVGQLVRRSICLLVGRLVGWTAGWLVGRSDGCFCPSPPHSGA